MSKRFVALVISAIAIAGVTAPAFGLGIDESRHNRQREAMREGGLGDDALNAKNYDGAIDPYTIAIEANSCGGDCGKYYFRRGPSYQAKDDCAKAITDYDKAQETLKDNGELYFNESLCHSKLNLPDLALADLDKAIKVNPDSTIYHNARCITLFNKHDFPGALPDCEFTLGAAPDDQSMLYATAMSAEQTGDKAKAAKYYKHLKELNPGDARASDGLKRTGG